LTVKHLDGVGWFAPPSPVVDGVRGARVSCRRRRGRSRDDVLMIHAKRQAR
jgi:hypothetical protein